MALSYNLSVTGDCQGTGQGAFYLEPTGGNPPYNVYWTSPALTPNMLVNNVLKTGLTSGAYLVQIDDSTTPNPQTIGRIFSIGTNICVTVDSLDTTCNNTNGQISVVASTTTNSVNFYLYSNTTGYVTSATTSGSHIFNSLSADIYYVDAVDIGGCTGRSSTCIVGISQTFDFDLYVVNNSTCSQIPTGRVYVTNQNGQSPYTYLWSNGGLTSYITGLTSNGYSVTVTDNAGCSLTKSANVINVPPPSIISVIPIQPSCYQSNGAFNVTITGGTPPYNYLLSNGLSQISYQTNSTFTGLSSGNYFLTVYDGGLCTATTSVSLATVNSFNVDSVVVTSSNCNLQNGIISIRVSGGLSNYTFRLYDQYSNLTSITNATGIVSFNNLSSGTYHLYINNGSGCQYDTYLTVNNTQSYSITTYSYDTTCGNSNGSLTVNINSGATYPCIVQITNTPPRTISSSATTFNNLSAGIYNISVTDFTGCTQNSIEVISSSSSVQFSLLTKGCGVKDEGSITAIITQGQPPFTINWSPNIVGQSGIYVTGLTQDDYSVTITDDFGCSLTKNTKILCGSVEGDYLTFNICDDIFTETSNTKLGIPEMFIQGYQDLTVGQTNCLLNSAEFIILLNIGSTAYTYTFYTTSSLNYYPSNTYFSNVLETLLESVDGIGSIIIDIDDNEIKISTDCERALSGLTISVGLGINYDICCASTPTPTPTNAVTLTPTPTVTITPTVTPTPTLPLELFRMNAINLTAITITEILSTVYGYVVDWGDGNIDSFSSGSNAPTHTYSSPYNGYVTVKSLDLSDITRFSLSSALGGLAVPALSLDTTEYTKLDNLVNSYLGYGVRLDGLISEIPINITYLVIARSNISGNTTDLPSTLTSIQMFNNNGNTVLNGDVSGLPAGLTYVSIYDNTISGNTTGLPSGLTYLNLQGDNALSGNTTGLPTGITILAIGGKNTISGSTSGLPAGLTYCQIYSMDGYFGPGNTISGNVSSLPTGITSLLIGGDNTVSGDTSGLPAGLTYLYVTGDNTISGDVADLPNGLTEIYLTGLGTITGNVSFLPPNLTSVTITGNNTIDGSISDFPSVAFNIAIEGNNTITGYTASHIWPTTMYQLKIRGNGTVSTANINNVLSDLATYSTTWSSSKLVSIKGIQTNPGAVTILNGRGVTVTITP